MRRISSGFLLLLLLLVCTGTVCFADTSRTDFSAVDISGLFDVKIEYGKECALYTINSSGEKQLVKSPPVNKGRLVLSPSTLPLASSYTGTAVYLVTVKNLNELVIMGTGKVKLSQINAGNLKILLGGTAELKGKGKAKSLVLETTGTTEADLEDLRAETAKVSTNGTSKAKVNVHEELTANANGYSSIEYSGKPKKKNLSNSVMASIKADD